MLRNVPVGSGRRKSKNSQAREAEKAATADAAKQQSMIATGAFDTFQQMLMNPSLAYSASGLGGAAAAAAGKAPMTGFGGAVVTGMAPLPPIAVQPSGFGGFSGAPGGLPGFAGYPPAKPTDSGRMTAASDPAITALLGGPTTVTTSTVTTFSGGPAVELKGRDNNPADARAKPTDSGAASGPGEVIAAQVNGGASSTLAGVGGSLMYGAGGVAGPHSGFQSDWVAAAGQMQVCSRLALSSLSWVSGCFERPSIMSLLRICLRNRSCRRLTADYHACRWRSSSCSRRRRCRRRRTCARRRSAWGSSRTRTCRACGPTTATPPGPAGRPPLTHGALVLPTGPPEGYC